jgi:hypothetical protein
MKRLLMFVGVAVIAAAMYVAASPASQQSSGVTAKQFSALKKQVASLSKSLKSTRKEADAVAGFLSDCFLSQNAGVWGVSQFGDGQSPVGSGTFGYWYTDNGTNYFNITALDFDGSTTPEAFFQAVDPTCVNTALRHQLKGSDTRQPLLSQRKH